MTLTPLAVAMLALLRERPMHCYEMYRVMQNRGETHTVKVRPGSLYHTMDRLVSGELAAPVGIDRDGGRPERTTYRITPDGCAAMETWVREVVATPVASYPAFPVAIGELHTLPVAEVVCLVERRIAQLEARLAEDEAVVAHAAARHVPEAYLLDRHYLDDMITAEVRWLRRLVRRLQNEELEWPKNGTP